MAAIDRHSLVCCPEACSRSLSCFKASLEPGKHPTTQCIEEHLPGLIIDYVAGCILVGHDSAFRVLSVGSGDGRNDLAFIEILSKILRQRFGKCQFFQRTIEPDKKVLELFRGKAEDLPESLKNNVKIAFEWLPITFQEYVKQDKTYHVGFNVVHFFHSLYFLDIESALKYCYEKELGAKGAIICSMRTQESALAKYGRTFSSQGLVRNHGFHFSSEDVTNVANKNGWRYVECPGEVGKPCDITAIFDRSSEKGNLLLDFLTQWVNISLTVDPEKLQEILSFWERESFSDCHGRKLIMMSVRSVIIFKGSSNNL